MILDHWTELLSSGKSVRNSRGGLLGGIEINRVDFFRYLKNSGQLLALFSEAISGSTRLLSLYCGLSHNEFVDVLSIELWIFPLLFESLQIGPRHMLGHP